MIDQPDQAIFVILTPVEAAMLKVLNSNKMSQAAERKEYLSAEEFKVRAELMQRIAEGKTEPPTAAPTDRKERLNETDRKALFGVIMDQAQAFAIDSSRIVNCEPWAYKDIAAKADEQRAILADMIEDLITNQQEKP